MSASNRLANLRRFELRRLYRMRLGAHLSDSDLDAYIFAVVGSDFWKLYRIPVYDCTSDLPKAERYTEIRRWLRSHPSVSRYAVLDDEGVELDGLPLFQPSSKTGLTTDMAKAMERYLNGASDETRPAGVIRQVIDGVHARLTRDKR